MLSDQTKQNRRLKYGSLILYHKKCKRLNYEKRIKIEALSKAGLKSEAIAKQIGCSGRTIRRELSKGRTELLNSDYTTRIEYSADIFNGKSSNELLKTEEVA